MWPKGELSTISGLHCERSQLLAERSRDTRIGWPRGLVMVDSHGRI